MSRRILSLALVVTAIACSDASTPVDPGPGPTVPAPTGPAPTIHATIQFGDPPVTGAVYLLPGEGTAGWIYAIDLDEDGAVDREGVLERRIGFDYRFDEAGTHALQVELTGPEGLQRTSSIPVVVPRSDAIRIVSETMVETDAEKTFEGIAVAPDGSTVYVGNFRGGEIHGIDAATLEPVARIDLWYGVEGLTVSPSGEYLFAGFKYNGAVRLGLPGLRPDVLDEDFPWFGFLAHALDDRIVLTGAGGYELKLHDVVTGERVTTGPGPPWLNGRFDVDPRGGRAVVIEHDGETTALHLVGLPGLGVTRSYPQPPGLSAQRVAFGPTGERVYVLASDHRDPELAGARLLVIDLASGAVERTFSLDAMACFTGFCVANPTARSREGRYVAFETAEGVLVIDTTTDLPVGRRAPGSVAASPVEDATFWTLRPDGLLRKIVVEP